MRRCTTPLLLVALLASATAAESSQQSQCAFHCKNTDKFSYETGKSYLYDYTVDTVTSLLGTSEESSRVQIKSKVEIEVSSPCEHILRLKDVELVESSRSSEFADALTKMPLRFSFQDGVIDHVCGAENEPTWVMNFKRGVLSTFQNSMTNPDQEVVEETDITGKCNTHYSAHVEGTVTNYFKSKDLDSCTLRPDRAADFATSSYTSTSPIQSLPIMRSTQSCHQILEDGRLRNAECEESHIYHPFSNHESGTVTKIMTTLVFISTSKASIFGADHFMKRSPLIFDSSKYHETPAEVEKAAKLLELLHSSSQDEINPRVPTLFYDLVANLRGFSHSQLTTLLATTKDTKQHKFLVDAILLLTTPASAETIRDLLRADHISDKDADVWFTSLAFIKNPNPDIFSALATLQTTPTKQAMLGISALINNYCLKDSTCGEHVGVKKLLLLFEAQLGSACRSFTEEEKERIVVALKALGNAGRWVNADSILERCYTEDNDMEIRVAALDAWRHAPCHYDRSNLMQVFSDVHQNIEVRIASYLSIMTCPTKEVIEVIKDRLISEPVNHVSSFVWTHLTNLHESAAPGKLWMHDLIGRDLLKQKFNSTNLKFSRNFESSFFMNEINVGSTVESNVIFSDRSFLPRSAMFNLTMDLFGESINFFEIGGRFEGFEAYIERFFGPNGYYPEETIAGILKNLRQGKNKEETTTLESILDHTTDEPSGSLYLRLFGNEMYYKHFHGLADIFSDFSNPMDLLTELARKGNVDYLKSFAIVDTDFSLPSVSGLPITLAVNGSATVGFKMSGTFLPRSLNNINIEGKIHPSAAIQMASSVYVDAFMARSGVKMVSTLHTSTSFDGKIIIQGGKLVDIAFDMPKEKTEVLKVNNDFFYYDGDREVQVIPDDSPVHENCITATSFLGLRICGSVNYPLPQPNAPYFPFIGPMEAQIFTQKTDTQSSYLLQFRRENNDISFLFDTPDSTIDRKVSLQLSRHENSLDISLYTPWKAINAHGSYHLTSADKKARFEIDLGQTNKYTLIANLATQRNNIQIQYKPTIVITTSGAEIVNLQGAFLVNAEDKKCQADLSLATLNAKPITFHAAIDAGDRKMNLQTSLNSPLLDASFEGIYQMEETSLSSNFNIEYRWIENPKQTIKHTGLLKLDDYISSKVYLLDFQFTPSQFPSSSIDSKVRTTITSGKTETKIDLIYGATAWGVEHSWYYDRVQDQFVDITASTMIKCPNHDINYMFFFHHLHNNDEVNSDLKIRLTDELAFEKQVQLNFLSAKYHSAGSITLPLGKFYTEASFIRIAPGQYKLKVNSNLKDVGYSFEAIFKNRSTVSSFDIDLDAQFVGTGHKVILDTAIVADSEKANADLLLNINDRDYTVKAEVCHTSLLLDVNFLKHMFLEAKISPTTEEKSIEVTAFWDKANDQSKSFHVFGMVSPKAIRGSLKYPNNEVSFEVRATNGKILLQAEWAPKQKITSVVNYSMGEEKSLSILVETPFAGYEKQSATVAFHAHGKEHHGSITIVWKNAELLSFSLINKYEGTPIRHFLMSEMSFTSSIPGYEQAKISLNHQMENTDIKSQLQGQLNYKPLQGAFSFTYANEETMMDLAFSSPFTDNLSVSLRHTLRSQDLSIDLEANYGPRTIVLFTAKGHVDISHDHDIVLVLKMDTSNKAIPSISANVNYRLRDSELTFLAELKANNEKAILNINGQKTVTGDHTAFTGNLRLITPVTRPLTFTISQSQSIDYFIYDIEMSRFWSDFNTVKIYAEGKVNAMSNFELSSSVSSLDTNAKAVLNYKLIANTLDLKADFSINGNRIAVNTDAVLDTHSRRAKMNVAIASSMEELQDINMLISHKNDGNKYETKLSLAKSLSSLVINHLFLFTDVFNWENNFEINNYYKLKNKQSLDGYRFHHDFEYTWYEKTISSEVFFDMKRQSSQLQIDASLASKSSFTEDFRAAFSYHHNENEINSTLTIEVEPCKKIVNSIFTKLKDNSGNLQLKLDTYLFAPVAVQGSFSLDPKKSFDGSITWNDNKITLTATSDAYDNKIQGLLNLDTTYLRHPVQIVGSYQEDAISKSLDFSYEYIHTHRITSTFSRSENEEKLSIIVETPLEKFRRLSASIAYNLHYMPYHVSTILTTDNHEYLIRGEMTNYGIQIDMDFDGKTGEFITKWGYDYSMSKAEIHVSFKSPITSIDDLHLIASYDLTEKYFDIKMKHASNELKLRGEFVDNRIIFKGSTPFHGWERLGASLLLSTVDIGASVFRNDYKIEITGKAQIENGKGQLTLNALIPFYTKEIINIDAKYVFEGTTKKINFDSSYGSKTVSVRALANLGDMAAPVMTLKITLPFKTLRRVGGEVKLKTRDGLKMADIKIYQNNDDYRGKFSITSENAFKTSAIATITTPLNGWSLLNLEAHLNVFTNPYSLIITMEKEGMKGEFSTSVDVNNKSFTTHIETSLPEWKLDLEGFYKISDFEIQFGVKMVNKPDYYEMKILVLKDKLTPKLDIATSTSPAQGFNFQLAMEADFSSDQKEASITFRKNSALYSLKMNGKYSLTNNEIKINFASPIKGYTSASLTAILQVKNDVGTVYASLIKEHKLHEFSMNIKVNDNTFLIDANTTIPGYERIKLNGDYSKTRLQHKVLASFETNNLKYTINGVFNMSERLFLVSLTSPLPRYNMAATGHVGNNRIDLEISKENDVYQFSTEYYITPKSISFSLQTPIQDISKLTFTGHYEVNGNDIEASVLFQRNNEKFEAGTGASYTPTKSTLYVFITSPVVGWEKLIMKSHYDIVPDIKTFGISVEKGTLKVSAEASYNINGGSFKIKTPLAELESLGASYNLTIDQINQILDASFTFNKNIKTWNFSAKGHFSNDHIEIKYMTPFEGYETVLLQANLDTLHKTGEAVLKIGPHTFKIEGTLKFGQVKVRLTTPFDDLKVVHVDALYNWETERKDASLTIFYNDITYQLTAALRLSAFKSDFTITASLPFPGYENISIQAKYDPNNKDQLILVRAVLDSKTYAFSLGGLFNDNNVELTTMMETPVDGWKVISLITKLDFAHHNENLKLIFEKDGSKSLAIIGKFVGDDLDLQMHSPLQGFENLKLTGSLDRTRRSVEIKVIKDKDAEASVTATSNLIQMDIKTPYELARKISLTVSVDEMGKISLDMKRNDNFLTIHVVPKGIIQSFQVSTKCDFWVPQPFTLKGYLNTEEPEAYLGAEMNGELTSFHIIGTLNLEAGDVKIKIQTPFQNFQAVSFDLSYNTARHTAKIEASSTTLNFKSELLENMELRGFYSDTHEHNQVNIVLSPLSGHFYISNPRYVTDSLKAEYEFVFGDISKATVQATIGNEELFHIRGEHNSVINKNDIEVQVRSTHTQYHRLRLYQEAFRIISLLLEKDGKQMEIKIEGDMSHIPQEGYFSVLFTDNLFHNESILNAKMDLNLITKPKKIVIELIPSKNKHHKIEFNIEVDVNNPWSGNADIQVFTSEGGMRRSTDVSGKWDFTNLDAADFHITAGGVHISGYGKLGIFETDFTFTSTIEPITKISTQWKFSNVGTQHDHFFRIGDENTYAMGKLMGTFGSLTNADIHTAFGVSAFMPDLNLNMKLSQKWDNTFVGRSNFTLGEYKGHQKLEYLAEDLQQQFTFDLESTTNIPGFLRTRFEVEYDFVNKFEVKTLLSYEEFHVSLDIDFKDLNPEFSSNSAKINLPYLGKIEMTFKHDFRNKSFKSIDIAVAFAGEKSSIHAKWIPGENYNVLNGKLEFKSLTIGSANLHIIYDINDIRQSHVELSLARNKETVFSVKAVHKQTDTTLLTELSLVSPIQIIPSAQFVLDTQFADIIKFNLHMGYADSKIDLVLKANESKVGAQITTTFEYFKNVTVDVTYRLSPTKKMVTLMLAHGNIEIKMVMELEVTNRGEGEFKARISTPFHSFSKFSLDATWANDEAEIMYTVNEVHYRLTGKYELRSYDNSSFEISFLLPDKKPIVFAASYNIKNLLNGTGKKADKLGSISFGFETHNLNINFKGFRNSERIYLQLNSNSSFRIPGDVMLTFDTSNQNDMRHGVIETRIHGHHLKIETALKLMGISDSHFTSEVLINDSRMAIKLVLSGQTVTLNVGYGHGKDLIFSISPRANSYMEGLAGKLDLGQLGYPVIEYEAEYGFNRENAFYVDFDLDLGNDKDIELRFVYDSEGVEARLNSLLTGMHRLRAKRSFSNTAFFTELGYNDYELILKGGLPKDTKKHGLSLEGEIFGEKILVDILFHFEGTANVEGKFIVETPFMDLHHIGGHFIWTHHDKKIHASTEILLPAYRKPITVAEIDLNVNGQIYGHANIDIAGHVFSIKSDLKGTSLANGYIGGIEIKTPFLSFPELNITTSIKAQPSKFMQTDLKVVGPYNSHIFKIKYDITDVKKRANIIIDSTHLSQFYVFDIIATSTSKEDLNLQISFNDNKFTGEYEITDGSLKTALDIQAFFLKNKRVILKLEAKHLALDNMEGKVLAVVDGKTHQINGSFKVEHRHLKGDFALSSDFVEGTSTISFDILIPTAPYTNLSFEINSTAKEVHSILFGLNLESGIHLNAEVNIPYFSKRVLNLVLKRTSAGVVLQTPEGTHKATASWRMVQDPSVDYILTMDLKSPLLENDYKFRSKITISPLSVNSLFELAAGAITHRLEGVVNVKEFGTLISFEYVSSEVDTHKGLLKMEFDFTDKAVATFEVTFLGKVSKLEFMINKNTNEFRINVTSPFLPSEYAMVEATVDEKTPNDIKLKLAFQSGEEILSGVYRMTNKSGNDMSSTLKILTPFEGYKKMTFGASYLSDTINKIHIYSDSQTPFKFNVEATFSHLNDERFFADVIVKTPIKKFEKIGAALSIPFSKFEPYLFLRLPENSYQVDAHYNDHEGHKAIGTYFTVNDIYKYGAEAEIRTEVPFEFGYKMLAGGLTNNFHLRTDSSFLHFLLPST
ncbi:uncharacterized protein LOC143040001 [Oratosquilla oratoria]|uniref:uncharacterized protein LOC143040001 n=1 Tax=Oratosquilla oratoria TaxID=337810 RepID=UPI003F769E92